MFTRGRAWGTRWCFWYPGSRHRWQSPSARGSIWETPPTLLPLRRGYRRRPSREHIERPSTPATVCRNTGPCRFSALFHSRRTKRVTSPRGISCLIAGTLPTRPRHSQTEALSAKPTDGPLRRWSFLASLDLVQQPCSNRSKTQEMLRNKTSTGFLYLQAFCNFEKWREM